MIHHLIWVWFQYGGGRRSGGRVYLPHCCMGAGEQAGEMLESLGLGVDAGWEIELTDKGVELMEKEFS